MRIEPGRAPTASRVRRGRVDGPAASAFEHQLGQARAPAGAAASALDPVASLESILLLNDIDDRDTPDFAARRDASEMLDRLDEIRHGLLCGRLSRRTLADLAHVAARDRQGMADPGLRGLLDEIALRARVELAKLARTA